MEKPKYLKLEQQFPNDWSFNRPSEWEFFDRRLDKAEAFQRKNDYTRAIKVCFEIIQSCPEYLPAINYLGLLYLEQEDLDNAIFMFDSSVAVGRACLPEEFEPGVDLIPSYWEDNRAFLYAHENLGLCCLKKALLAYETVKELNPKDDYETIPKLIEILDVKNSSIS